MPHLRSAVLSLARQFSTSSQRRLRFVQYILNSNGSNGEGPPRLGVQLSSDSDGDILEISALHPNLPNNLLQLIQGGSTALQKARQLIGEGKSSVRSSDVTFLPPLARPDKLICVGLNYKGHCDEQKKPYPEEPFFFNKFPSTIIGPTDPIVHPPNSRALDWEVELAVIIGKKCRAVSKREADDYIFGYTIANDVSARDWQKATKNNGQWLFAKSMDTFCPLGPAVVTKDSIGDAQNLNLSCSVNGVQMQNSSTSDMVHSIPDLVSFLSCVVTLLPGDVILTGTPSGVGVFRNPRVFLKPGDVVQCEISNIGKICNKITEFPG